MGLFDWLDVIGRLRDEGLTQAEIGERIGWTREQVKHYIAVLNTIGTEVLNLARGHQEGRVPENGTTVPTTTFTEGWFRDSGGGTSWIAHRRTRMAQDGRKYTGGS